MFLHHINIHYRCVPTPIDNCHA